jgi:uracil-DNA glycosylase
MVREGREKDRDGSALDASGTPAAPVMPPQPHVAHARDWLKAQLKMHKDTDNFLVTVGEHPN